MSDFNLAYDQNLHSRGGHAQPNVEWYQPSANFQPNDYAYQTPDPVASARYGTFDDEPPLLEELEIDLPGVLVKTKALLLNRVNSRDVQELDMGGALIYAMLLALLLLLKGKILFGVVLGWSVVGSIVVWFVVNNMAGADNPDSHLLDLYSCTRLLGYCMLPQILLTVASILLPRGMAHYVVAALTTCWAALTAAKLIVKRCPALQEHLYLVAYPCFLMYTAFALLVLY